MFGYKIIENKWMTRKQAIPFSVISRTGKPRGITHYRELDVADDLNCCVDHINKTIVAHPLFIARLMAGQAD